MITNAQLKLKEIFSGYVKLLRHGIAAHSCVTLQKNKQCLKLFKSKGTNSLMAALYEISC